MDVQKYCKKKKDLKKNPKRREYKEKIGERA